MTNIGNSARTAARAAALVITMALFAGCSSIRDSRGYLVDSLTYTGVRAGIDNQRSVVATLGNPTFSSQFGDQTWYYVSSTTGQRPFGRPRIAEQAVLAIRFDAAGNVVEVDRSGLERVVYLTPEDDETPTLGRERSFLEDLFGNVGAVGAAAPPGGGGPNG